MWCWRQRCGILEYGEIAMERHLTLVLIKSWDRRRKAFRIASREVQCTVFDVVMFTGLPETGTKVELDREQVSTEYAWAEVIWQVVVESIEDTQSKLARGSLSEVQLNRLYLLIQHRVCYIVGGAIYKAATQLLSQVWFSEHTTRFSDQDGERFPWIACWRKVDHGSIYDATELLAELEESEVTVNRAGLSNCQ
ncbi:hypothetical protein Cgig2_007078 [Carnegiea gigantea]|uniref:Uncharacterized protein n=1 Tax=Carnegiea gigantea TaxID=171969 RepID=A0A9Q1GLP7_9CARY|nr:hypothetical protein Cgig2_007078 [Carnegiea gigantea]